MPVPGLGSISAIIHMLAKGPDVTRSIVLCAYLEQFFSHYCSYV